MTVPGVRDPSLPRFRRLWVQTFLADSEYVVRLIEERILSTDAGAAIFRSAVGDAGWRFPTGGIEISEELFDRRDWLGQLRAVWMFSQLMILYNDHQRMYAANRVRSTRSQFLQAPGAFATELSSPLDDVTGHLPNAQLIEIATDTSLLLEFRVSAFMLLWRRVNRHPGRAQDIPMDFLDRPLFVGKDLEQVDRFAYLVGFPDVSRMRSDLLRAIKQTQGIALSRGAMRSRATNLDRVA